MIPIESALYQLEGGWIGDFYESLQNVGVMKTDSEDMPITMQRKLDYTRPAMVKYSIEWKHNDKQLQCNKDQVRRSYEAKQIIHSRCEDKR